MTRSGEDRQGVSRRGFLLGTATGLAAGLPGGWLAYRLASGNPLSTPSSVPGKLSEGAPSPYAMPGRYPGVVVEVRDERAVSEDNVIDAEAVDRMVDHGMADLTGAEVGDVKAGWGRFFERGDVVGIKVNPVGRKPSPRSTAVGSISSPALLIKVVTCLRALGIPAQDIIVFERYAEEFVQAGYADLMRTRPLDGVRWAASAVRYTGTQVDIAGFDQGRGSCSPELARHVVGYDPDVFTVMGFCSPDHDKRDDRRYRSHLSAIVSRMVNKVVTLPVLKDHRSAGVTLALKNMSHGMNNNVARSHISGIAHGVFDGRSVNGPNQCNTFIPQAVAQHTLRQRATLHILDGLIGVYEGGPGAWNRTWGTWRHKGLFFGTDPVAMDHVGWTLINAERARRGWPPVEQMGSLSWPAAGNAQAALAHLAADHPLALASLGASAGNVLAGRSSEAFNLRQPEHVVLAGQLGLGRFDRKEIRYRVHQLTGSA